MRPIRDWDEDYIINGIPPGEYDWVEFKGTELLDLTLPGVKVPNCLNELSKQLSAFANTGGGSIVYGVDDKSTPRCVDKGGVSQFVRKNGTKEWLEDVIPDLVEFQLLGVNVYPIIGTADGTQIEQGRAIYVIDVPDSSTAPHQANDRVYYARIGGRSRPIGHRIVMDIAGRATHPAFALEFDIYTDEHPVTSEPSPLLDVWIRNTGRVFANYVNGWIQLPQTIFPDMFPDKRLDKTIDGIRFRSEYFENTIKETVGHQKRHTKVDAGSGIFSTPTLIPYDEPLKLSRYDPILPGLKRRIFSERLLPGPELENHRDFQFLGKFLLTTHPNKRD